MKKNSFQYHITLVESQLAFDLGADVRIKPCKIPNGRMEFFTISNNPEAISYEIFTVGTDRIVNVPKTSQAFSIINL